MITMRYVDEAIVSRLVRELADDVPAGVRFVTDFVTAWEERVARILDAAERQDPEDVNTVLLSVRTASGMLGATALFSAATELQRQVTETRTVDRAAVARYVDIGTASCHELSDLARRLKAAV